MKQEEAKLQGAAVEYLRRALPRAIVAAIPNGGSRDKREAARLKWQGVLAGMPDLIILHDGRTFGIELKAPKGRLSDAQKDIADRFTDNAIPWTVARSLEEIVAFLEGHHVRLGARPS